MYRLCCGTLFAFYRKRVVLARYLGHCTVFKMLSSCMDRVPHPSLLLELYSRANDSLICSQSPFSPSLRLSSASAPPVVSRCPSPSGLLVVLLHLSTATFHILLRASGSPSLISVTTHDRPGRIWNTHSSIFFGWKHIKNVHSDAATACWFWVAVHCHLL